MKLRYLALVIVLIIALGLSACAYDFDEPIPSESIGKEISVTGVMTDAPWVYTTSNRFSGYEQYTDRISLCLMVSSGARISIEGYFDMSEVSLPVEGQLYRVSYRVMKTDNDGNLYNEIYEIVSLDVVTH